MYELFNYVFTKYRWQKKSLEANNFKAKQQNPFRGLSNSLSEVRRFITSRISYFMGKESKLGQCAKRGKATKTTYSELEKLNEVESRSTK